MKKQFLTIALAATVVIGGLCTAEAVPCKVGETPKAPAPCQKVECETPKAPCRQVKQKPTPEQMKAMMEKRIEEFNKALGLSDEQVAKAKEIRANGHNKMKPLMEKKKAKIDEIRAVMADDNIAVKVQDKKVETLRAELKVIDQDIRQARRDNEKEFQAILTDEQKVKYAQIKEEGRKHFRQHHKPQGPENFRHRTPAGDHRYRPAPDKK